MSFAHLIAAVHQTTSILAAPVDNPAPSDPTGGAKGVSLLLGYAKWGALIACAISAVVSGGMMGVGSLSNRPDSVDKGKRALIWSLFGVLTCAIAIPLVNQVFGAAA